MNPSRDDALRHPHPVEPGKTYPAVLVLRDLGGTAKRTRCCRETVFGVPGARDPLAFPHRRAYFTRHGAGQPHYPAFDGSNARLLEFWTCASEPDPRGASCLYRTGFGQRLSWP